MKTELYLMRATQIMSKEFHEISEIVLSVIPLGRAMIPRVIVTQFLTGIRDYEVHNQSACAHPGTEPGTFSTINQHVEKKDNFTHCPAPQRGHV